MQRPTQQHMDIIVRLRSELKEEIEDIYRAAKNIKMFFEMIGEDSPEDAAARLEYSCIAKMHFDIGVYETKLRELQEREGMEFADG